MSYHQFLGIGLSLVAVIISLHTKYKQQEKNKLRDLAAELKSIRSSAKHIGKTLENPHSLEDLDLRLYEIPREMLACKHEVGRDNISAVINVTTGYGEGSKDLDGFQEIFGKYKESEWFLIKLWVGNVDEMYKSDREYILPNPFIYSTYVYENISEVEEQYGGIIEEFNESLLENLESHLDSMVRQHTNYLLEEANPISLNISEFESAEDIGDKVFRELYYYDGVEEDLEKLEKKLDEVNEMRTTVLQASYS